MKVMYLAVIFVFLFSCVFVGCGAVEEPNHFTTYEKIIPIEKQKEATDWITKTVAAANPHSDEEPEDNILQAHRSAEDLFGVLTIGLMTRINNRWVFIPYNKCLFWQKKIVDKYLETGETGG